jgi:hypothetical protein
MHDEKARPHTAKARKRNLEMETPPLVVDSMEQNALSSLLEFSDLNSSIADSPRTIATQPIDKKKSQVKPRPLSSNATSQSTKRIIPKKEEVPFALPTSDVDPTFKQNVSYLLGIYKDVIVDKERRQKILETELATRSGYTSSGNSPNNALRHRSSTKSINTPRLRNLEIWAEKKTSLEDELLANLVRPQELERENAELKSKYEYLIQNHNSFPERKDACIGTQTWESLVFEIREETITPDNSSRNQLDFYRERVNKQEEAQNRISVECRQLRSTLESSMQEKKLLEEQLRLKSEEIADLKTRAAQREEHLIEEIKLLNRRDSNQDEHVTNRIVTKNTAEEMRMLVNQRDKWKAKHAIAEKQFQESEKRVNLLHETRRKDNKKFEQEKEEIKERYDVQMAELRQQLSSKEMLAATLQTQKQELEAALSDFNTARTPDSDMEVSKPSSAPLYKSDGILRANVFVPIDQRSAQNKKPNQTVVYSGNNQVFNMQPTTTGLGKRPQTSNSMRGLSSLPISSSRTAMKQTTGNTPSNLHMFNVQPVGYADKIIMQPGLVQLNDNRPHSSMSKR